MGSGDCEPAGGALPRHPCPAQRIGGSADKGYGAGSPMGAPLSPHRNKGMRQEWLPAPDGIDRQTDHFA